MPVSTVNGIAMSYRVHGAGPLVVLIMGSASPGRVWEMYQVPALTAAGFTAVTFENRGIAPSGMGRPDFTLDDMVRDTAALIEHLGRGAAHIVGTSLGARVAQELALSRPDIVRSAVFLTAHGRCEPVTKTLALGECELHDTGTELPLKYFAGVQAALNLSPATLRDERAAQDWLAVIEYSGMPSSPGVRRQAALADFPNRLAAYGAIRVPVLAVGYADDRILPPYLAREVADAIPSARYAEVADAGHFGALERPEAVNKLIVDFLGEAPNTGPLGR